MSKTYQGQDGLLRGKRGGISSKNSSSNWRKYYGEENYNNYINNLRKRAAEREAERERQEKRAKEIQDSISLKPMYDEPLDSIVGNIYFDHHEISKMNDENYNRFSNNLTPSEKEQYLQEKEYYDECMYENQIAYEIEEENGEFYDFEDPDY